MPAARGATWRLNLSAASLNEKPVINSQTPIICQLSSSNSGVPRLAWKQRQDMVEAWIRDIREMCTNTQHWCFCFLIQPPTCSGATFKFSRAPADFHATLENVCSSDLQICRWNWNGVLALKRGIRDTFENQHEKSESYSCLKKKREMMFLPCRPPQST